MGLKAIEILKNRMVNFFKSSPSFSYDHCLQFALRFISFDHVDTANLKLTLN